jgi:dephospho-CoA kinase
MVVIGIVGEKGAGKGTFVRYFKELSKKKISDIRFSDLLKQTLDLWDLPGTRENYQKMAVAMRDMFNRDALTHATHKKIAQMDAEIVLVEGVRWLTDEKMIRSFPKNRLVYISASPKLRFERLKKRNEKVGENNTTFARFSKEEQAENELLIPAIGKRADFKVDNTGSFEDLKEQVKQFLLEL